MEKTIEIPEGYEARIEGNKVIIERKESEDERIRKMLIEQMIRWKKCAEENNVEQDIKDASDALAYLERQKEQKPAEWSEEDVEKLAKIRASKSGTLKTEMTFYRQGVRDAFNYKGFRPAWKPSEEQMEALMLAIEGKWDAIKPTGYMSRRLEDLYDGIVNTFGVECKLEE